MALFFGAAAARAATPDLTLTATIEADAPEPFVGEMVILTLKGDYDAFITRERFEGVELANFTWLQLGRDIWSKGRKNGREYTTVERKLALYPQKAGSFTIGPFRHQLTIDDGTGRWTETAVVSNAVTLTVLPKPSTGGGWWLPARNVTVDDRFDMDTAHLADGATATRTVTITAVGQTAAALPPPPKLVAPWLIAFIAPEERTTTLTRDGPIGTVRWQWRLRPSKAEPGNLPAYDIPWFDTRSRQMRDIVLKSARFAYATITAPEGRAARTNLAAWLLPLLLGLSLPLVAALAGRRPLPAGTLGARLRRLLPDREAPAMRLARGRGDLRAYRRHAARRLARHGLSPERALAPLDAALFRRRAGDAAGSAAPVDLGAIDRAVMAALRRQGARTDADTRPAHGGDAAPVYSPSSSR
ncbi:BatD family protein [Jiella sonneratiae]|uniref:BatD family protein n=1 Tax=Jiella sonneratiae TaxID=2816856 RepID=A0ABS3J4L9_9HYPH|nr:BatD family protein [Jiella sonneratiae]MBO0904604.1 BatD family protein [Jiella sonneratiae]